MSEAVIQAKISRMGGGMADSHFCNGTNFPPAGEIGAQTHATCPSLSRMESGPFARPARVKVRVSVSRPTHPGGQRSGACACI